MPKRFSRYKFALKAAGGEAAAGSPLKKYQDFVEGRATPEYTREVGSLPGKEIPIYVIPFGEATDIFYLIGLSTRANAQIGLVGGASALKTETVTSLPDGSDTAVSNKFTSAAATVFVGTGTGTAILSQVTGVRYKPRNGQSYTLPFGKGAGATGPAATFKGRATVIQETVVATPGRTVSFRPEILRSF